MKSPYCSATELVASVMTLLTLPEVYLRVKDVVEDPDSCLSDLVNAISIDPGITARLLKLVNSAYFNLGSKVDNIRQAVNLLGMRPVHDLVLATTLTGAFSKSHPSSIDMRAFWSNSVRRAVYSHLLGRSMSLPDHERLFVNGLLSDIGHQVMCIQLPQQMLAAEDLSVQSGRVLHQVEKELLGFNYAEVGGQLMKAWNMPDNITEVVRHHLNPQLAGSFQKDAATVHLAMALTALDDNDITIERLKDSVNASIWALIGINPENLPEVVEQARAEIDTTTGMLLGGEEAA